ITKKSHSLQHIARSQAARNCFMDVLCAQKNQERLLRQMHECTILERIIPDFGHISSQMQYDMYHVYTTDDHTLRAIGLLNGIERGLLRDRFPIASQTMTKIKMRRALYLAVFLHDIAKGRGGSHSEIGAQIAYKIGPQLGLSSYETQIVAWLVLHHLAMSNVAFKRDLDDMKTIDDFADLVQTTEKLSLLLCLSVCDIATVGPKVWTSWKADLLRGLYKRTLSKLNGDIPEHSHVVYQKREAFNNYAKQHTIKQSRYFLKVSPAAQFVAFSLEELAQQCALIEIAYQNPKGVFAIDFTLNEQCETLDMQVFSHDHANLMEIISAAIAHHGGEVINARISTFSDSTIFDHFVIDNRDRRWMDLNKQSQLKQTIENALFDNLAIKEHPYENAIQSRYDTFKIEPSVIINNHASAMSTLVEITCRNRHALLLTLTRALSRAHLRINFARIATYGEEAVDVFYVKDIYGQKLYHRERIQHLKKTLLEALSAGKDLCQRT
ncbi:MAG: HD domain-containing protein, partial [Pseudomonadota bacterium]